VRKSGDEEKVLNSGPLGWKATRHEISDGRPNRDSNLWKHNFRYYFWLSDDRDLNAQ